MSMNLKKHPAIRITWDSFAQYRAKTLDIAGLQQNLSTATSLLDGSLPKPVRDTVEWAENEIEGAQFSSARSDQPNEVDRVWREVEEILIRHSAAGDSEV